METIQVKKEAIQNLYRILTNYPQISKEQVTSEFQKVFNDNILTYDIKKRVKTFEDAVEICDNPFSTDEQSKLVDEYRAITSFFEEDTKTNGGIVFATKSSLSRDVILYLQLRIICSALNEGWIPQFTEDEWRYYPYFYGYTKDEWDSLSEDKKRKGVLFGGGADDGTYAGFVYADSYSVPSHSNASIGSRLCLKSSEIATYCGTQFADLWVEYFTGIPCKKYSDIQK